MFQATNLLFIYVETPLHAGSGRGLGSVDLPIQRERITQYPLIQASSLKGRLRALAGSNQNANNGFSREEVVAIFGPETEGASEHAGALSCGDAALLLFPVRSLAGVFAWTTSVLALQRFQRTLQALALPNDFPIPPEPTDESTAWVAGEDLIAGDSLVLEEFSFNPDKSHAQKVQDIGTWIAAHALLDSSDYAYWRTALPKKLCILPENAFRDFVTYGTEIQTHIRLDPQKKTVLSGALWTTESLPADCLLYAPLLATDSRTEKTPLTAAQVLEKMRRFDRQRTQLGGDETTAQGIVSLRFFHGGER